MVVSVCFRFFTLLHYDHYADVSEGIDASEVHSVECVSKIESILLHIFLAICGAVWIQLIRFSYDDFENVYFILLSSSSSSNRMYAPFAIV